MTNGRGTAYSLGHIKHKTHSKEFYDYSFQQMKYDIKANIQFVVGHSGREKVHYIAHSEGGATMMAALADPNRTVPRYIEEHLETFYAFAPVVYLKNTKMGCLLFLGQFIFPIVRAFCHLFGLYAMKPRRQENTWIKEKFFRIIFGLMKPKRKMVNDPKILEKFAKRCTPSFGVCFQQLAHFLQNYSKKGDIQRFKKFDYGRKKNIKKYGTAETPAYDLSLISAKIVLYYAEHDDFIPLKSVELLEKALENADVKLMFKKGWDHCSFLYAKGLDEFYRNLIPKRVVIGN